MRLLAQTASLFMLGCLVLGFLLAVSTLDAAWEDFSKEPEDFYTICFLIFFCLLCACAIAMNVAILSKLKPTTSAMRRIFHVLNVAALAVCLCLVVMPAFAFIKDGWDVFILEDTLVTGGPLLVLALGYGQALVEIGHSRGAFDGLEL